MKTPIIWCIGGSDSGGGAGIQADLLAVRGMGGHACSVISAVTAQNSLRVAHIQAVSLESFTAQLNCLAQDLFPQALKIGMLADSLQLHCLAEFIAWLKRVGKPPLVVWDPVLRASSGAALSEIKPGDNDVTALLGQVDILTPNAQELELLTGVSPTSPDALAAAAQKLLQTGCGAVLVKGGHLAWQAETAEDYYFDGQDYRRFGSVRIDTPHSHGSGCTLASAMATALALDYPVEDAICLAKAYVNRGLRQASAVGEGPGPLSHQGWPKDVAYFPAVIPGNWQPPKALQPFAEESELGLYPIVDSADWVERLLPLGVNCIQLRIKKARKTDLEEQIIRAIKLGRDHEARVYINDHWQLAIRHGAHGVHLGQEDLQTADLLAIQQAGLRLGISTHGYAELQLAKSLSPSYLALGHLFATKTKQMPSKPQGLTRLRQYLILAEGVPTVAIGGISVERVPEVLASGIRGIALVSAIRDAANPEATTRTLLNMLEKRHADRA
ncbi:thiamine phosphate synthase [Bowmanella dokdonensis]|uniref:Thiamine-phosphate synthase n=1 Tax=Bowmanella dokdonensis TaxID=751969 RepID=A0A939DPI1_9ALTE|nr:thiamine phosphate synthase [Bowmanella dokdonensis]MBN7826298.1 thiamine phosphate synthase [Bowmanella dokdonensis]